MSHYETYIFLSDLNTLLRSLFTTSSQDGHPGNFAAKRTVVAIKVTTKEVWRDGCRSEVPQ
jgi:hypothetical protein